MLVLIGVSVYVAAFYCLMLGAVGAATLLGAGATACFAAEILLRGL